MLQPSPPPERQDWRVVKSINQTTSSVAVIFHAGQVSLPANKPVTTEQSALPFGCSYVLELDTSSPLCREWRLAACDVLAPRPGTNAIPVLRIQPAAQKRRFPAETYYRYLPSAQLQWKSPWNRAPPLHLKTVETLIQINNPSLLLLYVTSDSNGNPHVKYPS